MSDQTQVIVDSGQTPGPLTLERTLQLLDEFCAIYPIADNIDFRICATQEELYGPQASRDRVGTIQGGYIPATRSDQARQATFRGQCDLAYSSFRDEIDFGRCLHHEIAGHFGLNTCTADEKRAVLESILLSRQEPGIDELWARVNHNYADQPDLKRAEELYCTLAEELATFPVEVFETTQTLRQLGTAGPRIVQIDELRSVVAHVATGLHENTRDQVIFPVDRQAQFSRTASEKQPFHEVVATELISQIEAGTAPWQKPWNADGGIGGMPLNPTTGKRYKGINAIHLLAQGHSDPRWLTYKQASSLDAQVKKGERGTSIQYWKFEDSRIKTDESGKPVMGPDGTPVQERFKLQNPRVFYATVFNAEQIEGLAPLVVPKLNWDPVERAEQILTNSGARIEHAASDRAYYSPISDEIHLPLQAQFPSARNYYATALHELGHWTGHESRLKRDLSHPFRSDGYAREELRAEIASMLLSAELGLPHDPSQHVAYVASWVSVLKKDPLEIFRAAADAEKIHALAMSFAPELAKELNPDAGIATPTPNPSLALSPGAQGITPLAQPERATVIDSTPTSAQATTKVISMPLQPLNADDVRDALSYISPNEEQEVVDVQNSKKRADEIINAVADIVRKKTKVKFEQQGGLYMITSYPDGVYLGSMSTRPNSAEEALIPAAVEYIELLRKSGQSLPQAVDMTRNQFVAIQYLSRQIKDFEFSSEDFGSVLTNVGHGFQVNFDGMYDSMLKQKASASHSIEQPNTEKKTKESRNHAQATQADPAETESNRIAGTARGGALVDQTQTSAAMRFAPDLTKDLNPDAGVATPTPEPSMALSPVAQGITSLAQTELATVIDSASTSAHAATKVISLPLQPLSADDVRDALSYISPNLPRDDWARIGMALKSEFPNDLGLDLFDQWSSTGEGYDRNSVISTWRSIRADGPIKIGTLLKQAQDNGFKPRQDSARREASAPRMDAATQAAQAAAAAVEQQERLTQQQNAATQALQMWQDAQPGSEAAYLQRKNVQAHGTRTTANGTLLVPLVDDQGTLWNVQRILPTKLDNGTDKLFLKGGRKSGLFHMMGDLSAAPAKPVLFAEGYATAASLHEATGWPTVVCLDAGNLIKVTNQFRNSHPDALMIVAGDDDTQTMANKGVNPGRQKAGLAAEQTQAVLAFPQGLTPEHSDFNDLVAQLGTPAGHAQIRASVEAALLEYVGTPQSPSTSLAGGGEPGAGQLTAQQVLAVNALNDLKALGQPLPQAIAIEDTPEIRSTPISLAADVNPGDAPSAPLQSQSQSQSRFEVRRVGQVDEEQIAQFAQLSSAVYFAAGQDDAKTLQIHHNGTLLKGAQLNAYLDAMVLERTSPALAPGAQQLSQLHVAVLAATLSETPRVEGTPPYAVIRTENDQAEKIGDFEQLSSAVYFAAGQDDGQTLQIQHNGAPINSAQLSAYIDAMMLERTSPARSIGQAQLEQLRLAALSEVPMAAAVDQFENAVPTNAATPAEVLEANKTPISAPQVPADSAAPLARADLNNDLNLEALQAKRARDALQVRQEMGNGMGNAPKPSTSTGANSFESAPFLGMNSVSATAPAQDPSPDTYLYQDLRTLRERLAKEYQYDGVSKYFYRQGKQDLAFEDKGVKFNTPHHAPEVVASIAQLAHAKGWRELYLTGTAEFRKEMWLQASLLNIKVIGYEPEAIDHVRLTERKQQLAKDQASKPTAGAPAAAEASNQMPNFGTKPTGAGPAGAPTSKPSSNPSSTPSSSSATSAPASPPVKSTPAPALLSAAAAKQLDSQLRDVLAQKGANEPQAMELTLAKLYAQVQSPRVYLGKLLEHGPAPYKFEPKEQNSYFVKLQTQTGLQTVWGVDLPRALAQMLPNAESAIGQDILLAFQGVKKVQTLVQQKDASGQSVPEKWELVDRNTWFAQPVMLAYAQSQQELAQMPPVIPAPEPAVASAIESMDAQAASPLTSPATVPAKPVQAMQAATPPADRLRHALTQLGADPLQAEITLASVQSLFTSPKFQVGTLLEHGQAPLQFTQGQPPSYYLKLATEQGPVMLWSSDLPRAMNSNPVQLGQTIVAAYRGIELVQDGTRPAAPRNDWLVAPLDRLHEDAQQGVVQRMSNAQTMPPSPAPAASAAQEQQALYILREAMRQAGIPQEFAQATLKDAQQMLATAQAPLSASFGQPGPQLAPVRPAVQTAQPSPSHAVSKKMGPSL